MRHAQYAAACAGSAGAVFLAVCTWLAPSAARSIEAATPVPSPSAVVQQGYGTIKGKLVWGGADVPKTLPITNIQKDPQVCAATPIFNRDLVVDPATKGVRYAFAYLVRPKGTNPDAVKALLEKAPKVEIDQKNCEFLPYSTALHKDQPLIFKSSDPIGHNVRYSGFNNPSKNVVLPPNGSLEAKLQAERLPMPLNCDIHPWMKGWIMVFDHPFFDVTGEDGTFEITGVPAGEQNLVVWQEKVGFVTEGLARGKPVQVEAGKVTDLGNIVLDPAKVKK